MQVSDSRHCLHEGGSKAARHPQVQERLGRTDPRAGAQPGPSDPVIKNSGSKDETDHHRPGEVKPLIRCTGGFQDVTRFKGQASTQTEVIIGIGSF